MLTSTAVALVVCFAPAPLPRATPQSAYLGVTVKAAEGGLMIDMVYVNSPARDSGLRNYDVIVSVAEKPVRSASDLAAVLRKCKPNESVPVIVQRNGDDQTETVHVKLALKKKYCYLGANLSTSPPRILTMPPDSPARDAGLKEQDVIRSVDGTPVSNPSELVDAINRHKPGDKVPFVVERNGEEMKFSVKIGTRPGY
jgi:S1-C subfamily serine protease